jgi:mono/diheme cytochrome c family protein
LTWIKAGRAPSGILGFMRRTLTAALGCMAGVLLLSCAPQPPTQAPAAVVAQDIHAARSRGPTPDVDTSTAYFRPTPGPPAAMTAPAAPASAPSLPPEPPPVPGRVRVGRAFALANCRPCHVVERGHGSEVRFADAPAFHVIAANPRTTDLTLTVWLRNPHPTMPTLVLTRQETADVIAYIRSLRGTR